MRRVLIVALTLAAGQAEARPGRSAPHDDPAASALWREVIEPHGTEVAALVARARTAMARPAESADSTAGRRLRYAYGLLRRAHQLSPDNTDVLSLLGSAADDLGKTRQAIEALEDCIRLQGPEHAGSEVTDRLGTIYLRLGKLDDAVRWLRYAIDPIAGSSSPAVAVHLATALAARGQMSDAIDVLSNALPPAAGSYYTDPVTLVSFALA
ncbi:MAG TPA: hypothetical protein VF516_28655, partial [Kofleriaceae bacterium]